MTKIVRDGEDITEPTDSPTAPTAVSHAQHTPLPWYVGAQNDALYIITRPPRPSTDDIVDIPDVKVVAIVHACNAEANAEFIVRACNHHEALLAVARRFVEMYDNVRDHVGPSVREALTQADRAIANAEGK